MVKSEATMEHETESQSSEEGLEPEDKGPKGPADTTSVILSLTQVSVDEDWLEIRDQTESEQQTGSCKRRLTALKWTIYQLLKNFKDTDSIVVKKTSTISRTVS